MGFERGIFYGTLASLSSYLHVLQEHEVEDFPFERFITRSYEITKNHAYLAVRIADSKTAKIACAGMINMMTALFGSLSEANTDLRRLPLGMLIGTTCGTIFNFWIIEQSSLYFTLTNKGINFFKTVLMSVMEHAANAISVKLSSEVSFHVGRLICRMQRI